MNEVEHNLDRQTISQTRNYGIDALRIVSMIMIVTLHVLYHGHILESVKTGTADYYLIWFIEAVSYCAVNCYAIVSGYVGVFSKYRISNLVLLWIRVVLYVFVITVFSKIFLFESMGKVELIALLFPAFSKQYWYFSAYFLLFIFMPVLNAFLRTLAKNAIRVLIIAVVTVVTFARPISIILSYSYLDVFRVNNGKSALWLMILYLVGGYIRKYGLFTRVKTRVILSLFLISSIFTWGSKFLIQIISDKLFGVIQFDDVLFSYDSITVLLSAIFLLLYFERVKLKKRMVEIVSFLSPLTFSVYLIHDNLFVRDYLMSKLVWISDLSLFPMLFAIIAAVLGIYVFCSVIDLVRFHLFRITKLKDKVNDLERKTKHRLRLE